MHSFRAVDGTVCNCSVCLVLVRIGQLITDPLASPVFRDRALAELRILQGRLLDQADVDRAYLKSQRATGAPPPEALLGTPTTTGVAAKAEDAPVSEGVKFEKRGEEEKSPREVKEKRSRSHKKDKRKKSRKRRSRSRHKKRRSSPSHSERKVHPGARSSGSRVSIPAKEELSPEEAAREPIEDVKEESTEERHPPLLELQPKAKSRPASRVRSPAEEATPESREAERSPLPRTHRREVDHPREPEYPPSWHRVPQGTWRWPKPAPKGKKKRERQQEIRRVGWDNFHASKDSAARR